MKPQDFEDLPLCPECRHTLIEHAFHRGRPIEDNLGCVGDRYPGAKISGATIRCGCQRGRA